MANSGNINQEEIEIGTDVANIEAPDVLLAPLDQALEDDDHQVDENNNYLDNFEEEEEDVNDQQYAQYDLLWDDLYGN
ncbi:unnamed protein product [Caenorhabditis auriculariae]|uniref:Uncharacterized protein n=1 Tax=Caenorhabditis auriculariae TaxID=2777116 RepID=A0A8S1GRG0_9PELO|nr:unnamed protein product [Caenorhabditis auriculariae]